MDVERVHKTNKHKPIYATHLKQNIKLVGWLGQINIHFITQTPLSKTSPSLRFNPQVSGFTKVFHML